MASQVPAMCVRGGEVKFYTLELRGLKNGSASWFLPSLIHVLVQPQSYTSLCRAQWGAKMVVVQSQHEWRLSGGVNKVKH